VGGLTGQASGATDGLSSLTNAASGTTSSSTSSLTSAASSATASSAVVTDRSIEMVAESDYEFVVKAAKKNNYEFFTECGTVYFRKAKSITQTLMTIGPDRGMRSFDISYDTTGIVEKIIARGTDAGKGQVISANQKFSGKMSNGNKAKALIKGSQKVFLDASITSQAEAAERAGYLADEMAYRLGSLKCDMVGIPELLPGYFVKVSGLGTGPDNTFYIDRARHIIDEDGTYITELTGRASSVSSK
jgi:phage protein D